MCRHESNARIEVLGWPRQLVVVVPQAQEADVSSAGVRWLFLALGIFIAGCGDDMADEPRYDPLQASKMFANGMASRPLVAGTVARGHLRTDAAFYEGKVDGKLVNEFPLATVAEKLGLDGDE